MSCDVIHMDAPRIVPRPGPSRLMVARPAWRSLRFFFCEAEGCGVFARVVYEDGVPDDPANAGVTLGRFCGTCRDNLCHARAA